MDNTQQTFVILKILGNVMKSALIDTAVLIFWKETKGEECSVKEKSMKINDIPMVLRYAQMVTDFKNPEKKEWCITVSPEDFYGIHWTFSKQSVDSMVGSGNPDWRNRRIQGEIDDRKEEVVKILTHSKHSNSGDKMHYLYTDSKVYQIQERESTINLLENGIIQWILFISNNRISAENLHKIKN